ncbi:MAG: hypothetical protein LBT34_01040 [Clostridiales Family XIII bacterium]|jgi:YbbR domain-containing protein|nr:hypothetical protein [Clostridiales Family XIII bacterium]
MLKSNTVNRIIAVAVSLTLWAYVITVENPPTTQLIRAVPVQFTSLDILALKGLAVSGETALTVDVSVEGKRSDLANLSRDSIVARANLRGFTKGENSVSVEVTAPEKISVIEKRPAEVNVLIENLVTVNKPIRVEFTDEFPEGTEPGFITMIPEEIDVSGAKSDVDDIAYVRAQIESDMLTERSETFTAEAVPVNSKGEAVHSLKLSQTEIKVTAKLCSTKEVPLEAPVTGDVSENYELTYVNVPVTVTIRGEKSVIDGISSISAAPVDISAVNVTSKIPLTFNFFDEAEIADASKGAAVSIGIKGIAAKSFQYASSVIGIEGLTEGRTAYINTGSVSASIFGRESVITDFTQEDIKLYIDLSQVDLTAVSADVPVQARYEKKLTRVEFSPETVHVLFNADIAPETAPEGSSPTDSGVETDSARGGGLRLKDLLR